MMMSTKRRAFGPVVRAARAGDPIDRAQHVHWIDIWPKVSAGDGRGSRQRTVRVQDSTQGAAASVWAAVVAPAQQVGGPYCENCHVSDVIADDDTLLGMLDEGVRGYARDPENAKALWKRSEELVGETFA
jgi:hypothetical protein